MSCRPAFHLLLLILFTTPVFAQKAEKNSNKCGTIKRLESKFENSPSLRQKFEQQQQIFNRSIIRSKSASLGNREGSTNATIFIPVVFHIVLSNPNIVTDAQVQAQLDTLNHDFFGANGDSVRIPAYFKPLFGKSSIQFCLAQRTPDGDATTGIERVTTNNSSFGIDDGVKHSASGGAAIWNGDAYFNVWICALSGSVLGYSSFPDDGFPNEQGVVVDYRCLPGGSYPAFNGGKTLTHETGHYFNLYHTWGDDNGDCTGTDYVTDTPNQGDFSTGTITGLKTDNCTSTGDGIMYQNFMDYTDDVCLVMFTTEQVSRMDNALSTYRSSLFTSNGCQPAVLKNFNAQLRSIDQPTQRLCAPSFAPVVTIRNRGTQTLTSLQITTKIDNGAPSVYNWNGSLAQLATASVSLPSMTALAGTHTVTIFVSDPNSNADEDVSNDTLRLKLQYNAPVTQVSESFESAAFPPAGWDIVNPDLSYTWQRVTGIAKTGNASVKINNYDYEDVGQQDDLRLPTLSIPSVDSAFLSFQVAAATYTSTNTIGAPWDTLQVLVSTDCGNTYNSLYKKWGSSLVTAKTTAANAFVPGNSEWRKDSINLGAYIGMNNLLIAFRNTTNYENNIYLDDINLRTVSVNPNLKAQGFLVTPNPASGKIAVQFYPQPVKLKGIQLFNAMGQKLDEIVISGQPSTVYNFDLTPYPSGTYVVRAVFEDRVLTKKIIRVQ